MEVTKVFNGVSVEFSVYKNGEVEFKINEDLERSLPENKRYPAICRWLIQQFQSVSAQNLWCIAAECDADDSVRVKAYKKFLPEFQVVDGIPVYFRGDKHEVSHAVIDRYC